MCVHLVPFSFVHDQNLPISQILSVAVLLKRKHTQHNNALHYAECHYTERCFSCIAMLSTIMLNVVMLSVIKLNVVTPF